MCAEAARRGHVVLRGRATDGASLPFGLWTAVFRAVEHDPRLLAARGRVPAAARHLASAMPFAAEVDETAPRDDQPLRLAEAAVALVGAAAVEHRVVVVVDDVHWADADSLAVLSHLASQLGDLAVLLVVASRPEPATTFSELSDLIATIRRLPAAEVIDLTRLNDAEFRVFLERAASRTLPDALVQTLTREAAGNPLYGRELLRDVIEREDLDVGATGVPPSIRELVRQRLWKLSAETCTLVEHLALLIGRADMATAQAVFDRVVAPTVDDAWVASIDEALDADLLRRADGAVEFQHDIIKHAIADEPNPARAAQRHRRVADALVATGATALEIAWHFHESHSVDGVPWCLQAAKDASNAGAVHQAVDALLLARDLTSSADDAARAAVVAELSLAQASALLWEDAAATADEVPESIEFAFRIAVALKDAGAPIEVWSPHVENGLALVGDARDIWWARLSLLLDPVRPLAHGSVFVGQWVGHDAAATAIVDRDGDETDLRLAVFPNDPRDEAEIEELERRARGCTNVMTRLHLLDTVGRSQFFRLGAIDRADDTLAECADVAEQAGSVVFYADALAMRAMCVSNLGDIPSAEALLSQASALAAELGPAHRLRFVTETLVAAWLAFVRGDGDFARWADAATQAITRAGNGQNPSGMSLASFAVLCRGLAGDVAGVRAIVPDIAALLRRLPLDDYTVNGACTAIAHGCFEVEDASAAPLLRAVVDDLLAAGCTQGPGGSLLIAQGQLLSLSGDAEAAAHTLARGRDDAAEHGLSTMAALAEFARARVLLRSGHEADGALEQACQRFEAAAMTGWLSRAAALASGPVAAPATASSARPGGLSRRELEVLQLLARGRSNKEIAADLVVSLATAQRHVANIYLKLEVRNRAEATAWAYRHAVV